MDINAGSNKKESKNDPKASKMHYTNNAVVRVQRNQAEKQRRDRLNEQIAQLASLVPTAVTASKPLDKVSILRLAASWMRLNYSCLNPKHFKSAVEKYLQIHSAFITHLDVVEKSINGFVIATTFDGTILMCSRYVEDHIGYQNIDLLGNQVSNYILNKEKVLFKKKIRNLISKFRKGSSKKLRNNVRLHMQQRPLPRTNDIRYRKMSCSLTIHSGSMSSESKNNRKNGKPGQCKDFGKKAVILIFVEPIKLEPDIDVSYLEQRDCYYTVHGPQGEIIFADHRISFLTGYMPRDVLGTSAYQYIHSSDVPIALFAQRDMFASSDGTGIITYRLRIQDTTYIYLQSKGQIRYKDSSKEIRQFICCNILLNDEDGRRELKKFQDRFAPQLLTSENKVKPKLLQAGEPTLTAEKLVTVYENSNESQLKNGDTHPTLNETYDQVSIETERNFYAANGSKDSMCSSNKHDLRSPGYAKVNHSQFTYKDPIGSNSVMNSPISMEKCCMPMIPSGEISVNGLNAMINKYEQQNGLNKPMASSDAMPVNKLETQINKNGFQNGSNKSVVGSSEISVNGSSTQSNRAKHSSHEINAKVFNMSPKKFQTFPNFCDDPNVDDFGTLLSLTGSSSDVSLNAYAEDRSFCARNGFDYLNSSNRQENFLSPPTHSYKTSVEHFRVSRNNPSAPPALSSREHTNDFQSDAASFCLTQSTFQKNKIYHPDSHTTPTKNYHTLERSQNFNSGTGIGERTYLSNRTMNDVNTSDSSLFTFPASVSTTNLSRSDSYSFRNVSQSDVDFSFLGNTAEEMPLLNDLNGFNPSHSAPFETYPGNIHKKDYANQNFPHDFNSPNTLSNNGSYHSDMYRPNSHYLPAPDSCSNKEDAHSNTPELSYTQKYVTSAKRKKLTHHFNFDDHGDLERSRGDFGNTLNFEQTSKEDRSINCDPNQANFTENFDDAINDELNVYLQNNSLYNCAQGDCPAEVNTFPDFCRLNTGDATIDLPFHFMKNLDFINIPVSKGEQQKLI